MDAMSLKPTLRNPRKPAPKSFMIDTRIWPWRVRNPSLSLSDDDSKLNNFFPKDSGREMSSFAEGKTWDFSAIPDTPIRC